MAGETVLFPAMKRINPGAGWFCRLSRIVGAGLLLGLHPVVNAEPPAVNPIATNTPVEGLTVDLGGGVKLELVRIQPGTFLMGSFQHNPPVHSVTLTKPFYIGKYEVTQEQWLAVMSENRSRFKDAKRPVENVSWEDCQKFLATLNATAVGRRFSLPTEAQWEYSCRAGGTNEFSKSDVEADLDSVAWHQKNAAKMTQPVGGKEPNAWGLYDMLGNVWEWCDDWWGNFDGADEIDPPGPKEGWMRVLRGGSWFNYGASCRTANRGFYEPTTRNDHSGFRVVVTVP